MFGYIAINKAEMKFKDYDVYQAYYCGLCRRLKECYGKRGQLTLSYDMTFLIVLLTGLYEPKTITGEIRCIAHPLEKHPTKINEYTDYAASMNLILSYYKCKDDWTDERKKKGYIAAKALEPKIKKIESNYPEKVRLIRSKLGEINQYEKKGETNLDLMAGLFGDIMAEIFAWEPDAWELSLRKIGFFLGKFIYLMDAYEDIDDDLKNHNYNPLKNIYTKPEFEDMIHQILMMMMAECSKAFEQLPLIDDIDILRNVLYSGVWYRYEQVREKREKEKEEKNV